MFLLIMRRVLMLVGAVLPGVAVIMNVDINSMLMGVGMLVHVLVDVGMSVLVGVNHLFMLMLMVVGMGMFVGMQVLVFMRAFHYHPSFQIKFQGASEKLILFEAQ
jgi:hypothetical protein